MKNSRKWRRKFFFFLVVYSQDMSGYFIKILYFSILFRNYCNFFTFKFWKKLRSFWRKFLLPKIRLCKILDIYNVCQYQINPVSKAKFAKKQTFFARRFYTLYKQEFKIWDHFLPLLWTLDFGSGGKKMLKRSGQIKKKTLKNFFRSVVFAPFMS